VAQIAHKANTLLTDNGVCRVPLPKLGSQDLLRREMQHTPRKIAFSRVDPLCVRFFVCADFIIAFTVTLYHIVFANARGFANIFAFLIKLLKSS
jgi:hypothetical protein